MIIRKLDDLGRVVIPKEMRRTLDIREGGELAITLEGNGVIITKFTSTCDICNSEEGVERENRVFLCVSCRDKLNNPHSI